jgi:hypothetical protein
MCLNIVGYSAIVTYIVGDVSEGGVRPASCNPFWGRDHVDGIRDLSYSSAGNNDKNVLNGEEMINPDALKAGPYLPLV